MTVTSSPRLAITRWSADADPLQRTQMDTSHANLDDLTAIDMQGTLAARPAASIRGRYYFATDANSGAGGYYRDTGSAWKEITLADVLGNVANVRQKEITFAKPGTLSVGAGKSRWYSPDFSITLLRIRLAVDTAPTGASLIVDVHKMGTTIFTTQSNRPTITAGGTTAYSGTINVNTMTDGEFLQVEIDQVGSTVPGADMTLQVWWRPTA